MLDKEDFFNCIDMGIDCDECDEYCYQYGKCGYCRHMSGEDAECEDCLFNPTAKHSGGEKN